MKMDRENSVKGLWIFMVLWKPSVLRLWHVGVIFLANPVKKWNAVKISWKKGPVNFMGP